MLLDTISIPFNKSFLFFTDGLSIYFQSCISCSIGCCCCIVSGVARYLYAEIAHCWRSWDCIAYICWSWGVIEVSSFWSFRHVALFMQNHVFSPLNAYALSCWLFYQKIPFFCYLYFSSFSLSELDLVSDIQKLSLKCNYSCNPTFCCEWLDSNKDWRLLCFWSRWGMYSSIDQWTIGKGETES